MNPPTKLPFYRNEDWLAVGLAFVTLAAVLVGARPQLPGFDWGHAAVGAPVPTAGESILSFVNLSRSLGIGVGILVLSALGVVLMGGRLGRYLLGFPVVYVLAWLSQVVAGHAEVKYWGLEFVLFALLLGLLVSNLIGVPAWLREAVRTEYYIKIGLVILGAGILFQEVLQAGMLGVVQALLVIAVVWYACFYFARRLRVDDEFAVILASAVSICGVSAAIAACGAIQADRKKLSYVSSLVLIVAAPMMVVMPWIVRHFQMPEVVGGAWIGGTIDTSGAVVAAGALLGDAAMKAAVIVKFSQNALIGVAAFVLSVWWALRGGARDGDRPSAALIWDRFPKFVLGFMAASFAFSFLVQPGLVSETAALLRGLRTVWFALAFVSIGLETGIAELFRLDGGRPALAFLGAQGVNLGWTLLVAYLLFGGLLFPLPDFS